MNQSRTFFISSGLLAVATWSPANAATSSPSCSTIWTGFRSVLVMWMTLLGE